MRSYIKCLKCAIAFIIFRCEWYYSECSYLGMCFLYNCFPVWLFVFAENQGWYTFWHLSRARATRRNSSPMLISPPPINKKKPCTQSTTLSYMWQYIYWVGYSPITHSYTGQGYYTGLVQIKSAKLHYIDTACLR